jgi:hypothetical protein
LKMPVTAVSTRTQVRCAFRSFQLPTDWYLPMGSPIGLLYAQHGFVERKGAWAEFAAAAAEAGFVVFVPTLPSADLLGCTVQNLGNNTHFLNNVAGLFDGDGDRNGALARSFAAAVAKASREDLELPTRLVLIGHSAGGEAVLYVARRLAAAEVAAELRGVVLADPVPSFVGRSMVTSLRVLADGSLPIHLLAAPPSSCNARQSGTRAVVAELADREFLGALLTTGSHADILGGAVSRIERLTCGTPARANIDVARTLAFGWLTDAATGTVTPTFYPGGTTAAGHRGTYDTLVDQGLITTLGSSPHGTRS